MFKISERAFKVASRMERRYAYANRAQGGSVQNRSGRSRLPPLGVSPTYKRSEVNKNSEWPSIYQAARSYDNFLIDMPIRMGRPGPGEVPGIANGNPELLKIPNFFHLTPPAIEKHCKALKKLCTPWPSNLPSLPVKVNTRNYVFAGPNIRHPGAIMVRLSVPMEALNLDDHARHKLLQLVTDKRYDAKRNELVIITKQCPTRKQNLEYAKYLLKVLCLEAKKVEPWEDTEEFPENVYSSLSFLPPEAAVKIRSDIKYLGENTMLKVTLDTLCLDGRERERMIELAGDRYDPTTDTLSLEVKPKRYSSDNVISLLKLLYTEATSEQSCTANPDDEG